jgi:hypothetical protein
MWSSFANLHPAYDASKRVGSATCVRAPGTIATGETRPQNAMGA